MALLYFKFVLIASFEQFDLVQKCSLASLEAGLPAYASSIALLRHTGPAKPTPISCFRPSFEPASPSPCQLARP